MNSLIKKMLLINILLLILFIGIFIKSPIKILADEPTNSWYSFNSTQPVQQEGTLLNVNYSISGQTAYPVIFDPLGEGEVQSNVISALIFDGTSIYYRLNYYNQDTFSITSYDVIVYYGGEWVKPDYKYIFISSNIPDDLDEYLNNNGIWALTQPIPSSNFSDLLFSVADIIPNTIKNLTSFEILGFTFFAIFGTFILIILLIKLIKGVI